MTVDAPTARVRQYVAGWAALAVIAFVAATVVGAGQQTPSLWLLVALSAVTVLAATSRVRFGLPGGVAEATTMVELGAVPLMVLLDPRWAVAIAATMLSIVELTRTPGQPQKVIYNVSAQATAVAMGSFVYSGLVGPGFSASAASISAGVLAAGVFVTVHNAAFIGLMVAVSGRPLRTVLDENRRFQGVDYGIAASGVLVVVLAVEAPLALPLLALPMVLDQLRIRARQGRYELAAQKELAEAANEAKSEFLSRVSHELRTPLNAILGYGQLLHYDESLRDDTKEMVTPILQAGRHLLGLIDDVLDISRIETGRMEIELEPVSVRRVEEEVIGLIRPLAARYDIEMRAEPADDDLYVQADQRRLRQVLINLLSNAIKYNQAGGRATLRAQRDGDVIRIEISDTGPGISSEDLERLFVPFERLNAVDQDVEGTGLGLSISRHLVEAMGGALTVSSRIGQGSSFTVVLGSADLPPASSDPVGGHT